MGCQWLFWRGSWQARVIKMWYKMKYDLYIVYVFNFTHIAPRTYQNIKIFKPATNQNNVYLLHFYYGKLNMKLSIFRTDDYKSNIITDLNFVWPWSINIYSAFEVLGTICYKKRNCSRVTTCYQSLRCYNMDVQYMEHLNLTIWF